MIPQNDEWTTLIEDVYGKRARKVERYAIKKETDVFDRTHLRRVVDTKANEYELQMIDEKWFYHCKEIDWCQAHLLILLILVELKSRLIRMRIIAEGDLLLFLVQSSF